MDLDTGLRKEIKLYERMKIVLEADCFNTWNHVNFGTPSGTWANGSASFGTITSLNSSYNPRDFQLAGHFNF